MSEKTTVFQDNLLYSKVGRLRKPVCHNIDDPVTFFWFLGSHSSAATIAIVQ